MERKSNILTIITNGLIPLIQCLIGVDGLIELSTNQSTDPSKSQEECWDEMHKHPDFVWVVAKDSKIMYHVGVVGLGYLLIDSMSLIFSEAFADYEFTDGKPFGIKEE